MDIDHPAQPHEDPAPLRRYRELVSRLGDRSAMTDDEFEVLAPDGDTTSSDEIWVAVVVVTRVVPGV
jgi:hypothetical protein